MVVIMLPVRGVIDRPVTHEDGRTHDGGSLAGRKRQVWCPGRIRILRHITENSHPDQYQQVKGMILACPAVSRSTGRPRVAVAMGALGLGRLHRAG